jgi:hypothetical protein
VKRLVKKTKGIIKGAPSGLVISLLVHAGAFMLAGLLVVFSVVKKEEISFVPPPAVERPKMKLKKPKVKVKKSAKPSSPTRIMAKVSKAVMPELHLPELGGAGTGFGGIGDLGGFDTMPSIDEITVFGGGQTIGNDFVGSLYDFKRTRSGGPTGIEPDEFLTELAKFTRGGWKATDLSKYYKAPRKLYTTHFMIPTMSSAAAPTAFGEPDMIGYAWAAHYKGEMVHPSGGRFRFWAQGDDIIMVRLNGEIVVDGSVSDSGSGNFRNILSNYVNVTADSMKYYMGERRAEVGKWFTLEAGVPLDMEVLIGEKPGGSFSAMLAVEEEGVEYPKSPQGGPLLPMFKTEKPSHAVLDAIYEHLVLGEVCPTNGPVFCDYVSKRSKAETTDAVNPPEPEPEPALPEVSPQRVWTFVKGHTLEGEYITTIGDKVVLKTAKGKQMKFLRTTLSPEDLEFIELSNPPEFNIDFRAQSKQRHIGSRTGTSDVPTALQWHFGARVKQVGAGAYNHELSIEYFATGQQIIDRNKYILLDRGSERFTPSRENKAFHEFMSEQMIELMEYAVSDQSMGRKKSGYLIIIRDKRGEIIQHQASNAWLWNHYAKLNKLPVGAFMDDSCTRVYPTGPKATRY